MVTCSKRITRRAPAASATTGDRRGRPAGGPAARSTPGGGRGAPRRPGATGSSGQRSGCSDGCSAVGSTRADRHHHRRDRRRRRATRPTPRSTTDRAGSGSARRGGRSSVTPDPADRHAAERASAARGSAVRCCRAGRRSRSRSPRARRAASAAGRGPRRRGHAPRCGRSPRESIAAARSSDRSSASVITGSATSRTMWNRRPRLTAEAPGAAHALTALDELRGDAQRDGHGHADLVQRGRHRLEQPLRVGEGVGGADAEEQRRQAQAVVDRREHALGGHRARRGGCRRRPRAAAPRAA